MLTQCLADGVYLPRRDCLMSILRDHEVVAGVLERHPWRALHRRRTLSTAERFDLLFRLI